MQKNPYWLTDAEPLPPLRGDLATEAVVVGGGIAGLTVAQLLSDRGVDVVLLEGESCGRGATGRSSGFMTPDSELQVEQLVRRFGEDRAAMLWRTALGACAHVAATIQREDIECDYRRADSAYVATDASGGSAVEKEHELRSRIGLESTLYRDARVLTILGGDFEAAVRYGETFSITPHRYAVALRDRLVERGVRVFEQSPVTELGPASVSTGEATVSARMIFLCADHDLAKFAAGRLAAFHAQTFLAATAPVPAELFERLFPAGDLLVWDTALVYQYFRRTSDDRLLLGGGLLHETYAPPGDPLAIVDRLRTYVREHLPMFEGVPFTHVWGGLIGVTKDFLPIAGPDPDRPGLYYAGCGAGIPWSVLAARCAVECALDGVSTLARVFDPSRAFTDLDPLQPVLRKPLTFALAHGYAKAALSGTAEDVRRRRPIVVSACLAVAAFASLVILKLLRRR